MRTSSLLPRWAKAFVRVAGAFVVLIALLAAFHFPYDVDAPLSEAELAKAREFYAASFAAPEEKEDPVYVKALTEAAETNHIEQRVREFVRRHHLEQGRVLDVGAGHGSLQDCVEDYTGLDISPSAQRYFHKRFVLGTATAMPFRDGEFDASWSIWVLEHVPNPEAALREIRRVVKDGGVLYLLPAWGVPPWAAEGYDVRPYSDFGMGGRLLKATIPVRRALRRLAKLPVRALRSLPRGPARLHYQKLQPNYETFLEDDSDAVNSLDRHEVARWFLSRGDECLNCADSLTHLVDEGEPLVIRVAGPR
jgi:SAM-dependent methyltransferase